MSAERSFFLFSLVSNKALAQLDKQHKKAQETLDDLDSQLDALTKEMEEVRFLTNSSRLLICPL